MLLTVVLAGAFTALILVNVILTSTLQRSPDRRVTDGRACSSPSWSWQINVFVHARYGARGRAIKRWIFGLLAAQGVLACKACCGRRVAQWRRLVRQGRSACQRDRASRSVVLDFLIASHARLAPELFRDTSLVICGKPYAERWYGWRNLLDLTT